MLRYIKLITGEEVIGNQTIGRSFGEDVIGLENPRVITLIPTATGGTNLTLLPLMWSSRADSVVRIERHAILCEAEVPDEKFEKMYLQSISRLDLTTKIQT